MRLTPVKPLSMSRYATRKAFLSFFGFFFLANIAGANDSTTAFMQPGAEARFSGIDMTFVPAGQFTMGSPATERFRNVRTEVPHQAAIEHGFWMGKYEVTQAQWKAIMRSLPDCSRFVGNLPVDRVTWNECQRFIEKMNALGEGHYRLPTEAEWEYACRAGSTTAYCFGDDETQIARWGWTCRYFQGGPQPVGSLNPNAWGLYDMHGNVNEWTQCTCTCGPYNPNDASSNSRRGIYRGGSWLELPRYHRSAARESYYLDVRKSGMGLRLCRDTDPPTPILADKPKEKGSTETQRDKEKRAPTKRKAGEPKAMQEGLKKSTPSNDRNAPENLRGQIADICAAAFRCDLEACKVLLSQGVDANGRDQDGRTALHYAAMTGAKEVAEMLIQHGADLEVKDKNGLTPADWAEALGRRDLAAQLRKSP